MPKYIEKNGDIEISMRAKFTTIEITTPSAPPTTALTMWSAKLLAWMFSAPIFTPGLT